MEILAETASRARASSSSTSWESTSQTATTPASSMTGAPPNVGVGETCAQIPREAFLSVAAYLCEPDLVTASQVCQAWRAALFSYPKLWTTLSIRLPSHAHLAKAQWWCQRTSQRLGILDLSFDMDPAIRETSQLSDAFDHLASIVRQYDGGRRLYSLVLSLWTFSPWSLVAVNAFIRHFMPKGFLNALEYVTIRLPFEYYPIAQNFLHCFKHIFTLRLESIPHLRQHAKYPPVAQIAPEHYARFLSGSESQADDDQPGCLEDLYCSGLCISATLSIPRLQNLRSLTLRQVLLSAPFWHLLQGVSSTLEFLRLDDYRIDVQSPPILPAHAEALQTAIDNETFEELSEEAEYDGIDVVVRFDELEAEEKELLVERLDRITITLEGLTELVCFGPLASNFWAPNDLESPLWPNVIMPKLAHATFYDVNCLEEVVVEEDDSDYWKREWERYRRSTSELSEEEETYSTDALWTLCSTSSRLATLDLSYCNVGDSSLCNALPLLDRLQELHLRSTRGVSEILFSYFGRHLPSLRLLDIRDTPISARCVADLASSIHSIGGRLEMIYMNEAEPFTDFATEACRHDYLAYNWLHWLSVLVDWPEKGRKRRESKAPWGSLESSRVEYDNRA